VGGKVESFNRPHQSARHVLLTFDFLLAQRFNLSAVHLLWRFAFGAARFDWIFVQIVGQPAQIAVANEWIPCQMSVFD
jgi:hypothetical protein